MGAWKQSERRRNFGTSFGLVVITPPPCDPPHHDLDDEGEMRQLDVEYRPAARALTARCGRNEQPRRRPPGGTPSTARPEQLIDTRFPDNSGSVVTFLDRHRRAVFGTVTELRRHQPASLAETGRWRVPYAPGSGSFEAGPTGGATMQQVELPVGFLLRATWSDTRDTLGAVAGTVRRPSAELQRPRGREALSAHPPATVDDTDQGEPRSP